MDWRCGSRGIALSSNPSLPLPCQKRHNTTPIVIMEIPVSLSIRETQFKTTMRHYLTPIRMAVIKNTKEGWEGLKW
jgi:hypothetical protein